MLTLDAAQHVPIHGHVGANDEFVKIVMKAPQKPGFPGGEDVAQPLLAV